MVANGGMTLAEREAINQTLAPKELQAVALRVFHQLWSRDHEHDDYDKNAWCALQTVLLRLGVKV